MPTIHIELELGDGYAQNDDGEFYPVEQDSFDEQILDRVVASLTHTYARKEALVEAVKAQADKYIAEKLSDEIDRVIRGPLQTFDYQGRPKGDPFTVNELVVKAVAEFASAPAGVKNSYGRSDTPKNLEDMVRDTVTEALANELAPAVKEARQQVADAIRAKLSASVSAALVNPSR